MSMTVSKKKSEYLAEMRSRELTAPRLAMAVPGLASLQILVHEHSATACATYRKHVVVGSAPALFVISCGDERCEGGGHDITRSVIHALSAREVRHEAVHACDGMTGTAACSRRIHFELFAEYHTAN
jgi:hypothetical protein